MTRARSEAFREVDLATAAAPLRRRAAPHVFLFAFILLAAWFSVLGPVQAHWGDRLYEGPLPEGEAVPFHAEAGDVVAFRVEARYTDTDAGPQESTLTVRDPSGAVVWVEDAGFRVYPGGDAPDTIEPAIPHFRPAATGEHTVTWTHESGTESTNTVRVVANGYELRPERATAGYLLLVGIFVAGAAGLLGTRSVHDAAEGWRRFWPVVGMSAGSAVTAVVLGVLGAVAVLAWLGGAIP